MVLHGYRCNDVGFDLNVPVASDLKTTILDSRRTRIGRGVSNGVVKVSLGCHVIGFAFPSPDPGHALTQLQGVRARLGRVLPVPKPDILRSFRRFCALEARRRFPCVPADYDFSVDAWLDKTMYDGVRKAEILKAHDDHYLRGYSRNVVNLHTKREGYPCFKPARGIYARGDYWKSVLGPIVKAMEECVYDDPCLIKHIPVCDRAKHLLTTVFQCDEGLCYGTDYSAFESSFTAEILKCEFEIYKHLLRFHRDKFETLMNVLLGVNRFKSRFLTGSIIARRMSGEMNTALGNALANMFVLEFLARRNDSKVTHVVEGDDGLFRVDGHWRPEPKDWSELGFSIKIETFNSISESCFCQLVSDPSELVNIASPYRKILNFGWSYSPRALHTNNKRILNGLLLAKAQALACELPHCPMMWALSRRLVEILAGYTPIYESNYQRWLYEGKNVPVPTPPGINTRRLFERLYNIPVESQLAFENYILSRSEPLSPIVWNLSTIGIHDDCIRYYNSYLVEIH